MSSKTGSLTVALMFMLLLSLVACRSLESPTAGIPEGAASPITRSGSLTQSETWSGEVLVADTVIVPEGVTLAIAPGTTVQFRHYRGYREGKVGLVVEGGTLLAVGTPQEQIWFTSDAPDSINGDWAGISIYNSSDSRLDYVIVEYGEIGVEQFFSQADVTHSIVRWNNSEGLYAEMSRATFAANTIYGNAYHAIALENFNEHIDIKDNLILGDGHQSVHIENTDALVEGNDFRHFDVSEAAPERVISLMGQSHAVVRRNRFEIYGGDDPFAVEPESTLEAEDNDLGDGHIPPPTFDYQDVRRNELGYLPGDPEDRYLYVFDPEDETRRVVARYGEGLGLGWSLAYVDGGLWRFAAGATFVRIDVATGEVDYASEYANPEGLAARGLTFDGESFWAHDHVRRQIVQFRLGTEGGYPDVGSGHAIEVVNAFDVPEKEYGGGSGIATDGEFLFVPSITDPTKLYKLDKAGNVVEELHFDGPLGVAIAWDGTYFWSAAGNVIQRWTPDGHPAGMIYGPAVETWDLDWGDGYLWTINRTCENWDDAKVFQVEVRDQGTGEQGVEGQGAREPGAEGPGDFAVTVDVEETGAPISPYVYGAFIEHQGRCIYGGIWAEMLQDRKFYYPVEYYFPWGMERGRSPWRALPFDTVVEMDTGNVFVGEHTPRIDLDGRKARGIAQDGLGLVEGKRYEGYVFLAAHGPVEAEVRLVWGPGPEGWQAVPLGPVPEAYTRFPFRFTSRADTDDGRLEIVGTGTGSLYIGVASLMPADNVEGMRADVVRLLKDLGFTVYRWPGGIFVNDYNWREAVGDRDRRPPRLNAAYWSEVIESNDFGPDEFLTLCRLVGAEPYVVVSATGPNDARMAAEEVEYLNGGPDTPMGQLRAANGHPEPYHVRFWGVGNEMWAFANIADYIEQHNRIAEAMQAVDPFIQIVGVGGLEFEGLKPGETWTESMLAHSADHMDLISEHFYGGSSPVLIEHAGSIAQGTREFVAAHRRYRQQIPALQGRDIRLALDEWNYFWGDRHEIYGEAAPRYYFRDALGIARGLHEVFRDSDLVYMVNIHPVNVHGQVKTTQTDAAVEATGLVMGLYRHHFGTLPVAVRGDAGPLDVVAAWNEDRTALTVGVVNPTEYAHTLRLTLEGAAWAGGGRRWLITTSDPWAYNEPGRPPEVTVEETPLDSTPNALTVPPLTVVLYELPTR